MKLTTHFTLEEFIRSNTATRLKINNLPNKQQIANLLELCREVLEPIREAYGKPIIVTSGYRCPELNKAVGGVATSEHLQGMAADIRTLSDTKADNKKLWMICIEVLKLRPFGQLINEHNYDWIHLSYNVKRNRKQILELP